MADEKVEWSEWWLPTHPEHRVHGALTFDPIEGPRLQLADPLPHVGGVANFPTATLFGEAIGGKKLTLLDPFVTGENREMTQIRFWSHLTIIGTALLRGVHLDDPDTLTVNHAIIRFAGLREVCRAEWPQDEKEPHGTFAPYVKPKLLGARAVKVNGAMITFRHVLDGEEGKYTKRTEEQIEAVLALGRNVTIEQLEDGWLQPLESLVVFAAGAPAPRQKLTLVQVADTGAETPIEVFASVASLAPKAPDEYPRPLLPFAALKKQDARFFRAWWKLHMRLGLASDFLVTVLEGRMFDELKLTTRMGFLESYHRALHNGPVVAVAQHKKNVKAMAKTVADEQHRTHYREGLARAGEQNARQRITELFEQAAKTLPESAKDLTPKLIDSIVKTRNAYVHLDAGTAEPLRHLDLTYATSWLRTILQINVLLDLGLSRGKVGGLMLTAYDGGRKWPLTDYR